MTLAALIFSVLPLADEPVRDRVDVAEVNYFYDDCGKLVFTQLVWWDWCGGESEHRVVAWRLSKSDGQRPRLDHPSGEWVSRWHDGEIFREVRAASFRETWTQADVELVDRDYLPKDLRRELTNANANARSGQ
jgi:hypothetical protein